MNLDRLVRRLLGRLDGPHGANGLGVAAVAAIAAILTGLIGYQIGHSYQSAPASKKVNRSDFASTDDGVWVVSSDPGSNIPPLGRSLFDFLTIVDVGNEKKQIVPYPFTKLIDTIKSRLRPESETPGLGLKGVLIPLGRSLQRSASAPEFFRYPRVVIGVDGFPLQKNPGGTGMLLRDRMYVGFNEKAAVLEIISYNELAGRYEYQIAHDYREGGKAQVVYANRSVCLSCHQNGTPIFSDRPWSETNAHPEIANRIAAAISGANALTAGQSYMGLPISVNESQPQGIDNTKFRANLIPATHFLWQRLCELAEGSAGSAAHCRAQVLSLALRMGFTNQLDATSPLFYTTETATFVSKLTSAWTKQWPAGLVISSPRIPNRNPLEKPRNPNPFDVSTLRPEVSGQLGSLIAGSNIPAEFEPLNKRPAFDLWKVSANGSQDTNGLANWLRQIVGFYTDVDWKMLDQLASQQAIAVNARTQVTGLCEASSATANKISLICEGGLLEPLRLAGFIAWDSSGKASGAFESLAIRATAGCDLSQGAEQNACPEALGLTVRGQISKESDGSLLVTLAAINKINGLRTRFSDGNRLENFQLRWFPTAQPQASGEPLRISIAVNALKDFAFIEQVLAKMAHETASGQSTVFAKQPFRRMATHAALRAGLGGASSDQNDCCEVVDKAWPPAKSEDGPTVADAQLATIIGPAAPFIRECAVCHRNNTGFPTNFLYGNVGEIQKQLSQCAERIWYRVSMHNLPLAKRGQSPMPPIARLNAIGATEEQWRQGHAMKELREASTELLKRKGITTLFDPSITDYNSLPICFGSSF